MDNKLSELKAAAMAATPGPWILDDDSWSDGDNANVSTEERYDGHFISIAQIEGGGSESGLDEPFSAEQQANARYITAANPDVVLALLAELEAKDKRIAELEQDELAMRASSRAVHEAQENHINQQQDIIESLEKKNVDLGRALGAAEKRIAVLERERDNWQAATLAMRDSWREERAELEAKLATPVSSGYKLPADWRLDESTGAKILMYKDCSVIEDQQAEYVLSLIQAAAPEGGNG